MKVVLNSVIDNDVKNGVFEVPNVVTSITDFAFHSCTNVEKVVIKNPQTYINPFAFNCCPSIKEICMPTKLIKEYSFHNFMQKYKITELSPSKTIDEGRGGK